MLDLAVANSGDNTVSILVNDGTGKFSPAATPTVAVGVSPLSVAVGDFLGNGKLDLAVANQFGNDATESSPGTVSILLGDGTGSFTPAATLPVGYSPYAVAVGDFNGDGVLDLAVANWCGNDLNCTLPRHGVDPAGRWDGELLRPQRLPQLQLETIRLRLRWATSTAMGTSTWP